MIIDFTNSDVRESNSTVLNNSYYGGLLINSIEGKSEQNGTPNPNAPVEIKSVVGKNKLPILKGITSNGVTGNMTTNGKISVSGTPSAEWSNMTDEYAVKININANDSFVFSIDSAKSYQVGIKIRNVASNQSLSYKISPNSTSVTVTPSFSGECYISVFLEKLTSGVSLNDSFKPMLRVVGTDDTYVPYGNLAVKTVGKNKLNVTANSQTSNGVTFTVNNDKSITLNGTATADTYYNVALNNVLEASNYILTGCPSGGGTGTYQLYLKNSGGTTLGNDYGSGATFTLTSGNSVNVTIKVVNGATLNNLVFKPMLRSADVTDATYEPYQCSTVNFTANLHGIGDVKDRIIKKDGLWQIERRFKEVVFDGSSDEGWNSIPSGTSTKVRFEISVNNCIASDLDTNGVNSLNTHFQLGGYGQTSVILNVYTLSSTVLLISKDIVTTLEEFKTWLAANPMTLVYRLKTPEYEVLPPMDQSAINSLLTFNNTTYISTDSAVEPVINTTYGISAVGGYALLGATSGEAAKLGSLQIVSFENGVLITKSEVQL